MRAIFCFCKNKLKASSSSSSFISVRRKCPPIKRVALFDTVPDMKTFDISVNVLNDNVLMHKLLWKERGVFRSHGPRATDVPPPKQAVVPGEQACYRS